MELAIMWKVLECMIKSLADIPWRGRQKLEDVRSVINENSKSFIFWYQENWKSFCMEFFFYKRKPKKLLMSVWSKRKKIYILGWKIAPTKRYLCKMSCFYHIVSEVVSKNSLYLNKLKTRE